MIALPPENEYDWYFYSTATDANIDSNDSTWSSVETIAVFPGVAVRQQEPDEEKRPQSLRPPKPRRSFRPPGISVSFARRPVNRHPSARRAFRY